MENMTDQTRPTIVAYGPLYPYLTDQLEQRFTVHNVTADADMSALPAEVLEARALVSFGSVGAPAAIMDALPKLEMIGLFSVGYDKVDVDHARAKGIRVTNTPDVLTETTADTGFALILATARRVVELANWVRDGHWQANLGPAHFGCDVHGKTLGIVGMGRIGEALARRAAAGFGMRVLYHSQRPKPEVEARYAARQCSLDELLQQADFVCLTVPLSASTEGLIGARELALMKPEAILVNISRGRVVDEPALVDALRAKRIRGAGLDVFVQEPLSTDSPLLQLDNVVATPHIGSATQETRQAMARCAVDNLLSALAGERPANLVNEVCRS